MLYFSLIPMPTPLQPATKIRVQKLAGIIILSWCLVIGLHQASRAQGPGSKLAKFQLDDLTVNYSKDYLGSIFDSKIPDSVKILALGEVSHGGYEPIAFKANMVRYLIEKKGYRKIFFEREDFSDLRVMRKFLCDPTATDTSYIIQTIKKEGFTDATTIVFPELLKWIKQFNIQHPKDMVYVYGFDLGTDPRVINFILNRYIIPYSEKEGEKYVYKLNSDIADPDKIKIIEDWLATNKKMLQAKLSRDDNDWLSFYIHNVVNGVNHLVKEAAITSVHDISANLYRDSVLFENVKYLGRDGKKAIVWAHNGHVIRTDFKYMGTYLAAYLKEKYYVIATDFSKTAAAEVVFKDSTSNGAVKYITKNFIAGPTGAGTRMLNNYRISEGVFFHQDLIGMGVGDNTNAIDANGIHLMAVNTRIPNPFDALAVFSNIYPTIKSKPTKSQ